MERDDGLFSRGTGNGEKLIKTTGTSLFTLVFAKFANFVSIRPTTTMLIIQTVLASNKKERRFQGLQVSVGYHSFLRLSCLALQSISQCSLHTWPQNVRQWLFFAAVNFKLNLGLRVNDTK